RWARPPRRAFVPPEGDEPALSTLLRLRRIDREADPALADLVLPLTKHAWPEVRASALVTLGTARARETVAPALRALSDPARHVRDAASWALRELLLDGVGWNDALASFDSADDMTAEALLRALAVKAVSSDAGGRGDLDRLGDVIERALGDPRPAVRTVALSTARTLWIWNLPLRERIQRAWLPRLERVEPNALAETALRYSTRALLQANQFAGTTPFAGLDRFERALGGLRSSLSGPGRELLDRRLASMVATYFQREGANNVHQLRYASRSELAPVVGEAVRDVIDRSIATQDRTWARIAIEAAAGVSWDAVHDRLIAVLETGDPELAAIAARSLENPRRLELSPTPERAAKYRELIIRFLSEAPEVVESFTSF